MRFAVSILYLTFALTACQAAASVKSADLPAALDDAKVKPEITPSKIYGDWELEFLEGLEQAFEAEEKTFADRGETILWNTADAQRGLELSYDFNALTNETNVILRSSSVQEDYYSGIVQTSLKDITYKDTLPPTLLYSVSNVMDASGEIELVGPAPIEVVYRLYQTAVLKRLSDFRLDEDNQVLIFEDALENELARFRRKEAAQ